MTEKGAELPRHQNDQAVAKDADELSRKNCQKDDHLKSLAFMGEHDA